MSYVIYNSMTYNENYKIDVFINGAIYITTKNSEQAVLEGRFEKFYKKGLGNIHRILI